MKLWVIIPTILLSSVLVSCGIWKIFTSTENTVSTVSKTVDDIDKNDDGKFTFEELLMWCLASWLGPRGIEAAGTAAINRRKNQNNEHN